jgi:hypothetical protein
MGNGRTRLRADFGGESAGDELLSVGCDSKRSLADNFPTKACRALGWAGCASICFYAVIAEFAKQPHGGTLRRKSHADEDADCKAAL